MVPHAVYTWTFPAGKRKTEIFGRKFPGRKKDPENRKNQLCQNWHFSEKIGLKWHQILTIYADLVHMCHFCAPFFIILASKHRGQNFDHSVGLY